MAKADPENIKLLAIELKALKEGLEVTYKELCALLGKPCSPQTLQHRTMYPDLTCSQKLLNTISKGIADYKKSVNLMDNSDLMDRKVSDLKVGELVDILNAVLLKK